MKISIITPSYNQGKFIERTILSVLEQNYHDLEYVVIDGGSTDNTLEILKKYEKRIKWISEPDRGQSHALNKGFKMATGEIIGWLNSDDLYKQGSFEIVMNAFRDNPEISMVYGDCDIIDSNDKKIGFFEGSNATYKKMLMRKEPFIPQMTAFFRREIFNVIGYIDEEIHYAMDTDFFIRILKKRNVKYIHKNYASHRFHNDSKSVQSMEGNLKTFENDKINILKKHGSYFLYYYYFRYRFITGIKRMLIGKRPLFSHKKGNLSLDKS